MSEAPLELSLDFPQEDVRAIFDAMEQGARYLNWDIGKQLQVAMASIIRSLQASTRVAPKTRDVSERSELKPWRDGRKAYDVTGYFGKPRSPGTRTVHELSIAEVKRKQALIRQRGLAKNSWLTKGKMAGKFSTLEIRDSGDDQYAKLTNRLPYISEALEDGPRDVETAMERAASAMMHSIEKQLVKRMGLGSLS